MQCEKADPGHINVTYSVEGAQTPSLWPADVNAAFLLRPDGTPAYATVRLPGSLHMREAKK